MVAVISVDAYPFFQTWLVTLRIFELVFPGCTVPPDSKDTKLESSNQVASPSANKNTRVVLVLFLRMVVRPCSYFQFCEYFWGLWVSFVTTDEFSVSFRKINLKVTSATSKSNAWCVINESFYLKKNDVSFPRYQDFCVFMKSLDFKICDIIISIAA